MVIEYLVKMVSVINRIPFSGCITVRASMAMHCIPKIVLYLILIENKTPLSYLWWNSRL